nr:hypothetical protein GCM10025732_01420 [Glycomyces mayteni]
MERRTVWTWRLRSASAFEAAEDAKYATTAISTRAEPSTAGTIHEGRSEASVAANTTAAPAPRNAAAARGSSAMRINRGLSSTGAPASSPEKPWGAGPEG